MPLSKAAPRSNPSRSNPSRSSPSLSNPERTQQTRTRLLLAAVETVIQRGYAATTIAAVQERAGASRGAVLHHFPTKAQLLVDAVEYLADAQLDELDQRAAQYGSDAPDSHDERLAIWLDLTWSCFASRLFLAVLELWIASRTEPELRLHVVPYERRLGNRLRELAEHMFPDLAGEDRFRAGYEATLVYYRGLALSGLIGVDGADQERMRTLWASLLTKT